jgi:hypothetical protein
MDIYTSSFKSSRVALNHCHPENKYWLPLLVGSVGGRAVSKAFLTYSLGQKTNMSWHFYIEL